MPIMLMESNLRYGSFHFVKMALFLRKLSINKYFSKDTERKLLSLIIKNLIIRHWIYVEADIYGYKEEQIHGNTVEKMIDELHQGNTHNAYYYSLGLLEYTPEDLSQILLDLGAIYIPDTLGHSISCFYPVIKYIINTDHPACGTALFSFITYLGRFKYKENILDNKLHNKEPEDYSELLKKSASGKGIVNLHHMITFYIMNDWEKAYFNKDNIVPYQIFIDWIDDKAIDRQLENKVDSFSNIDINIKNYKQFSELFRPDNLNESIQTFIHLMEKRPDKAIDWIFRVYTDYYTSDWDPHYFTSLYCAINLYLSNDRIDKTAKKMAVYQSIQYFFENIS